MTNNWIFELYFLLILFLGCFAQAPDSSNGQTSESFVASNLNDLFQIEGKVLSHDGFPLTSQFLVGTKIVVNYGQYYGFLR